MYQHPFKRVYFRRLISLGLVVALLHGSALRAQSDYDIIQAITLKDFDKFSICLARNMDLNKQYGPEKKTALMMAIEKFEETLKGAEEQKQESTVDHLLEFGSGAALFTGGLGVAAIAGFLLFDLKKKTKAHELKGDDKKIKEEKPLPEETPASGVDPEQPTPVAPVPESVPVERTSSSRPLLSGMASSFVNVDSDTVMSALDDSKTLQGVRDTLKKGDGTLKKVELTFAELNNVLKIIAMTVLAAGVAVGVVGVYKGAIKAVKGLSKAVRKPVRDMYRVRELEILKKMIFILLRQEHTNLTLKNNKGETALDMTYRYMLGHINSKSDYRCLAEIEQLIVIRQLAS